MTRLNDIRPQRRKPWKILARVIIGFEQVLMMGAHYDLGMWQIPDLSQIMELGHD